MLTGQMTSVAGCVYILFTVEFTALSPFIYHLSLIFFLAQHVIDDTHRLRFSRSCSKLIEALLPFDNRAGIDLTFGEKQTPFMRQSIPKVYVDDPEDPYAVHNAALGGDTEVVKECVEDGADLEAQDKGGWTVLQCAAGKGHEEMVRFLLQKGASVDSKGNVNWNALHQASWDGYTEVVECLLQSGADPTETDRNGETALHHAAWCGHLAVIKVLLEEGADPNHKDTYGQTALHLAANNDQNAAIRLLLDGGADPKVKDIYGQKPCSIAEKELHHSAAKILREREKEMDRKNEDTLQTSVPTLHVDPAIMALFTTDFETAKIEPYGQARCSILSKLSVKANGKVEEFFMKTGPDGEIFIGEAIHATLIIFAGSLTHLTGEHESLTAIHSAVPSLCPRSIAHGKLADSQDYFLITEFIDKHALGDGESSGLSLAQKLAKLASTPAPIPEGFTTPVFGFPVATYVGRAAQDNSWSRSWPKFYAENRLGTVLKLIEERRGKDPELALMLARIINEVVPRLLGNGHLGGKEGVRPVLVHGNLWSGNKTQGKLGGDGGAEELIVDPGCSYAHSEFELGTMRMFGGFPTAFFTAYHRLVPKTEPTHEYDDRMALYQL